MKTKTIGKLYPPKAMFFREGIGEAKAGKLTYEMACGLPTCTPIIRSGKSGRWFALSWQDLIELAVQAGIDEPESHPSPPIERKA